MSKRDEILEGAMRAFERHGFRGIGVDAVLLPSGASTRTLYKHFGSRDGLVLAVVEQRHQAFLERLRADPESGVAGLFKALALWQTEFGARGCMLLRAHGEYAGDSEEIAGAVRRQKTEFLDEIGRRVEVELGRRDEALSLQIWLLFEGATAAASVAGAEVVQAAAEAVQVLLSRASRT
ncbi:TetR/AcrR family transcriptional regulator [Cereibacter sphaeroides]|uniref:TetR/AcrR family transcriptional regulator n=1 Tax=Cereibacter sphaeroides TaxID=1063 RepID=UPI000191C991|nr:TetR/AcrR family transcriptional regulator [Cereibacter sphaeroides]ACM02703.1 Transcriptional Regulator, TetR family protein [Cereibacter sphaeroides KD131]